MEFSKQEYWSGLSFTSPEDLLDPGSPALQAHSFPPEPPGKAERTLDNSSGSGTLTHALLLKLQQVKQQQRTDLYNLCAPDMLCVVSVALRV